MGYADMHIHSMYSDGSYSPEEIVRRAKASGVSLISVCDHNLVRGTLETAPIARAAGLKYVGGVEIDTLFEGCNLHILCYGADLGAAELSACLARAREKLDGMSVTLLERMRGDYPALDEDEYDAYAHNPALGGWKMLEYLREKGVTDGLHAGFAFYERYGVRYADAGFEATNAVISRIHRAGGRAVLAHPGVSLPAQRMSEFDALLARVWECGLDGVECDYPRHAPGLARRCREFCAARGGMITAGSDCHGAFAHNEIGQTRTSEDRLALNGLAVE